MEDGWSDRVVNKGGKNGREENKQEGGREGGRGRQTTGVELMSAVLLAQEAPPEAAPSAAGSGEVSPHRQHRAAVSR